MYSDNAMTNEDVKALILKAKSGDNKAWENLYAHFERYVHERAWKRLRKLDMPTDRKKLVEEDLYQAGWQGFLAALHGYDPRRGEFLTYATHFIDGEMTKELKFAFYSDGLAKMPDVPSGTGFQEAKMPPHSQRWNLSGGSSRPREIQRGAACPADHGNPAPAYG